MAAPLGASWFEHVDLMQVIIVGLLGVIIWFGKRDRASLSTQIHEIKSVLFKKLTALETRHDALKSEFDVLKGEHNHEMLSGGRRSYDPPERIK